MRRTLPLVSETRAPTDAVSKDTASTDVTANDLSASDAGSSDGASVQTAEPRKLRIALVGPIQQEPLALQYLAAAATRAGHEAVIVPYGARAELDRAVSDCLHGEPFDLIGLGIAFQNNIDDYMTLIRALRRGGFAGHLTAGGHVPTFCFRELLRDLPELDTVVRHDGEETLVEILEQLRRDQSPRDISGLVWRSENTIVEGPVRRALGELDTLAWPRRSEIAYTVGGLIVDFVITARGCVGECNYCSIAAYTTEQRKRYRLRDPEAVAEEIAAQVHGRGARVIFVQDDLFVLPSEARSVERIERIDRGLRQRGVNDVVFWVKGRPESITPAVCQALRKMGAIHLFLGVESASAKRLSYLGRLHQPHHNTSAIAACRDSDIVPSFNFMLFDPDSSIDDLEDTLRLAELHVDLPWNVCRTEIYSGTALRNRLEAEGRLEGDYRSYGYRMLDPRAEVLFRILRVSLHERALAIESLLNRLISVSFARQIHQSFFPGARTDELARRAVALSVEARTDTVRAIREALAFVQNADIQDIRRVQRFAVDQALAINDADLERRRQTEEMWQHLHFRGQSRLGSLAADARDPIRDGWGVAAGS